MENDINAKLLGETAEEKLIAGKESESEAATAAAAEEEIGLRQRVWMESNKLWMVAGPAIFTRFSTFGVSVISQAFIGHVGPVELAAYALVFTVLVRFANGILLGLASALDTLCGQAFGAKQLHMLGIYLQRSWIILIMCTFVLVPIFFLTTPILSLLGQAEDVSTMAGKISLWFIPIMFSYIFSFTFQMYLQSQSKNSIIAYLAALSLSLHLFFSWLTVSKLQMGVQGAMSSMIMGMWIPIIGQFVFVLGGGCRDTWRGFSSSAFSDLWPVIKLSLSSAVMICLELWYNTVLILLTGQMKDAKIAIDALSICLNINGWGLMISLGFLAAAGVRVANELGAGNAKGAKFSILVVVCTSFSVGSVLFVCFMFFQGKVAYVFTESPEVAAAVADMSPLLSFSILLNSVQPVLSGVAVGAGWQTVVACVNITCYYLIGIPLGTVLGFLIGYEVKGIWIGMMIGTAVQTLVLIIITYRTDWDKQVVIARARVNRWVLPPKSDESNDQRQFARSN